LFALLPVTGHALVKFNIDAKFNGKPVMVTVSTSVNGLHGGGTSESRKPVLVSNSDTESIQPPFATPMFFSTVWVKFFHPDYLPVAFAVPKYSAVAGVVNMGTIHLRPVDDLQTYVCKGLPAREVYSDKPAINSWLAPAAYPSDFQDYIKHMEAQHVTADYSPAIQRLVQVLEQARAERASCPPPVPDAPQPLYPPFTVDGWDPSSDQHLIQLVSIASLTRKQREQYFSFVDTYGRHIRPGSDIVARQMHEQPFASELSDRMGVRKHGFDYSLKGKVFRWNNENGDLSYEVKVGDYFIRQNQTCVNVDLTVALSDPALASLQNSRAFYDNGKFCYLPEAQAWRPL
jgi:hypothetical protein